MEPISVTITTLLVQSTLLPLATEYLLQRLGLKSPRSSTTEIKPVLDEYLQRLTTRLDEDRIAKLYGAFSSLKDAPKSVVMNGLLIEVLSSFHEVAQIPQQGVTGRHPNSELRCMAFVGMAASYILLQDRAELILEKMIEAVSANADTAKHWFGEDLVSEIISRFPRPGVICPKCSFENPAGSRFCTQDGQPLTPDQEKGEPTVATVQTSKSGWYSPVKSKVGKGVGACRESVKGAVEKGGEAYRAYTNAVKEHWNIKTCFYQTQEVDLQKIAQDLVLKYQTHKYEAQQGGTSEQIIVQLRKGSTLAGLNKALGISLQKVHEGTLVQVGTQDWADQIDVGAVDLTLRPLVITGAVTQYNLVKDVLDFIDQQIRQQQPHEQMGGSQ